jgi:hypothetical protein
LSPLEAYIDYGARSIDRLRCKLAQIDQLKPDVLCVLFDDMRGDMPQLAAMQARITQDIASMSAAPRLIMCPTYYSEDPVLERVFGARPEGYWQDLGDALDPAIDFFWTGERVCSPCYDRNSVAAISAAMARAPVLWDNYPVNDGEKMSRLLHLRPFSGRPPAAPGWLRGHLANPMNQAWLSRIPLCTMADCDNPAPDFATAVERQCPPQLAQLLQRDLALFSDAGLDAIQPPLQRQLLREYGVIDHPCAQELVAWLQGAYAFDPACLTD